MYRLHVTWRRDTSHLTAWPAGIAGHAFCGANGPGSGPKGKSAHSCPIWPMRIWRRPRQPAPGSAVRRSGELAVDSASSLFSCLPYKTKFLRCSRLGIQLSELLNTVAAMDVRGRWISHRSKLRSEHVVGRHPSMFCGFTWGKFRLLNIGAWRAAVRYAAI
jgi:hypothetical protein